MNVEVVEHDGTTYAKMIWADTTVDRTTFFSPAESSFQFELLAHEAGYQEVPHAARACRPPRATASSRHTARTPRSMTGHSM